MVVVTIELWPHGDESQSRPLGTIKISNDATGNQAYGNYSVELSHAGTHIDRPGAWKTGRVRNYFRNLSPYHLVARALAAAGIK